MPTSGIVLGRNVKLLWGGVAINHLTSISFSGSAGTIDLTSYDSARFAAFKPGTMTGTISGTMFIAYDATEGYDEMIADFLAGTEQSALISTAVTGDSTLGANGFVSSIEKSSELENGFTANFTLQLTGTITAGTVA
jgi:hypothetical protein